MWQLGLRHSILSQTGVPLLSSSWQEGLGGEQELSGDGSW